MEELKEYKALIFGLVIAAIYLSLDYFDAPKWSTFVVAGIFLAALYLIRNK